MSVDISLTIETKKQMLECHQSQFEWLQYHNKYDDFAATMLQFARWEGKRIGVDYAESFIQHLGNGHPTDNVLKSILGQQCVELPERPEPFWET